MRFSRAWPTMVGMLIALLAPACAPAPVRPGSAPSEFDVIGAEELQQHPEETLFVLIQRVRPTWLQSRPPVSARSANLVVVVLDGIPHEPGLEWLRNVKVADVSEVRRLGASDATTRFGTGMTAGAILVTTKRGGMERAPLQGG